MVTIVAPGSEKAATTTQVPMYRLTEQCRFDEIAIGALASDIRSESGPQGVEQIVGTGVLRECQAVDSAELPNLQLPHRLKMFQAEKETRIEKKTDQHNSPMQSSQLGNGAL